LAAKHQLVAAWQNSPLSHTSVPQLQGLLVAAVPLTIPHAAIWASMHCPADAKQNLFWAHAVEPHLQAVAVEAAVPSVLAQSVIALAEHVERPLWQYWAKSQAEDPQVQGTGVGLVPSVVPQTAIAESKHELVGEWQKSP
jgi:hypothetical protein